MAETNKGKITQIIGAVLDIRFDEGKLPEINEAIVIATRDGGELTVEVSQHLGDDTVRCIAMGPTDGLVRGMEAIATGAPISVPVGENTLGRLLNVVGEAIDDGEPLDDVEKWSIHRHAPTFAQQSPEEEAKQFRLKEEKAAAKALAEKIMALTVKITVSSGGDGRLYGSVTSKDISEALSSHHKIDIDKRKLVLAENIKAYGTYNIEVKVYPEVSATLKVVVTDK